MWSQAVLAGKTVDVFDPPDKPRFALLFLHGLDLRTLADNPVVTSLLEHLGFACACPHGQRSWWGDRICAEFDPTITAERFLVAEVVPFCTARWQLEPRALGITGFDMGGQGALRMAFKYPERFAAVAAVAPALEYHELYGQGTPLDDMYDSKEQCRQDIASLHIHPSRYPPHLFFCIDPEDDFWYRGCDRLHEKLNALGVPHTCDLATSAGGHSWSYFEHMAERALGLLRTGLEQESRRLL
jgi:pimeloyl-ACP methyl ester carboxylesterase